MNDNLPPQLTALLATANPVDDGLLLRELQHRHANDVATVIAAVRICARRIGTRSRHSSMLIEVADTLQAIGDVNVILADPGADGQEDLAPVIEMLCDAAGRRAPAHVRIVVEAQSLQVRTFVSRRIALVVNELIVNAVKHGHGDGRAELITVRLVDDGAGSFVVVDSEGPFKGWSRTGGKGVGLVDEIVAGLGGEVLRCRIGRGVRTMILLPTLSMRPVDEPF
jgi:two-component sensor histidine kinase